MVTPITEYDEPASGDSGVWAPVVTLMSKSVIGLRGKM